MMRIARLIRKVVICSFAAVVVAAVIAAPGRAADGAIRHAGAVKSLHLNDAVDLALRNNILIRTAHERVSEADGVRLQSVADLLPHLSAAAYQQRVWHENPAAMGFSGLGIIGPFNNFDARLFLTQKLFDISAFARGRAGSVGSEIARLEEGFARQKVVLAATIAYLEALRSFNGLCASNADQALAERLLLKALHQHEAGVATGVDVARARTRAAEERLRAAQARFFYRQARLELARVTGLSFGAPIRLADRLALSAETIPGTGEALSSAMAQRLEMQLSRKRVLFEKYRTDEAGMKRLPSVEIAADYGWNGTGIDQRNPETGQGIIRASMPLFEGGMITGAARAAASRRRQAELALGDIARQVDEDVRLALCRIRTGTERVLAAEEVVRLAQRELEMASDRFAAGIGDNIEVLTAQTAFANAADARIAALAEYQGASANLYAAMGEIEEFRLASRR
ncbi:MAG: TolC family protein [Candidatus Omnitrophota bacterium]